jgi:hypothetical protein
VLSEKETVAAICFSREKSNPNARKPKRQTKPQRAAAAGVKQRRPKIRTVAVQTLGAGKSSEAKATLALLQPWVGPPAPNQKPTGNSSRTKIRAEIKTLNTQEKSQI